MLEGGRGVPKVKQVSPDTHFARSQFSPGLGQGKGKPLTYSQKEKVIVLQAGQTRPDLTATQGTERA